MKFSVSSSALLSLLATTGKVISNKNTLPILDYFLMELNGNELKVTTSDLETTLIGSITVDSVGKRGHHRGSRQTDARLAEGVFRAAADHRRQRQELGDNDQLEERFALDPRSQRRELSRRAAAERRKEGAFDGRGHARQRHQQDHLRHGRRRVASRDERHLHQSGARRADVRGHRRAQTREVRGRDRKTRSAHRSSSPRNRPTCSSRCC